MAKVLNLKELLFVLLCVFLHLNRVWSAHHSGEHQDHFSYYNINEWGKSYPQCLGKRQSPIDIYSTEAHYKYTPLIKFGNYDQPLKHPIILSNNGHTIIMTIDRTESGKRPYIEGGLLQNSYNALQLHFHWGSKNAKGEVLGAEHFINGKQFNAEMHIVHMNNKYKSLEDAMNHEDGLAVLGMLIEINDNPHRIKTDLKKIFNRVPKLLQAYSNTTIDDEIILSNLFRGLNTRRFFTYSGSLTTPPCSEAVTWIVFHKALPVQSDQLNNFYQVIDPEGLPLINNFRPIQKLKNQIITNKYKHKHSSNH